LLFPPAGELYAGEDRMEQTYASRLQYLDAEDLDDSVVDFDGLDVQGTDGSRLGDVDGFLVDPASGRVLYTVVDSGGWFRSRRFLIPIGHATVDREGGALRVDVSRDTLRNFPDFDESRFREFSDEEFRSYERRMIAACSPDEVRDDEAPAAADTDRHFRQPAWWTAGAYAADRLRPVEPRSFESRAAAARGEEIRVREARDREQVIARGDEPRDDVSPHPGRRAQPGDVLGIETAGETTGIGDSAEDEDERRRKAERPE
jgi:hypothetical protein